ncbi:hypothetical protein D3C80_1679260 [compost metagenome]
MIEDVFTKGVGFHIGRQGSLKLAVSIRQCAMRRRPASTFTDTAAVFQAAQKRVTQKRLLARHQGIPGSRCEFGKV